MRGDFFYNENQVSLAGKHHLVSIESMADIFKMKVYKEMKKYSSKSAAACQSSFRKKSIEEIWREKFQPIIRTEISRLLEEMNGRRMARRKYEMRQK